jgi:hypothetical protein
MMAYEKAIRLLAHLECPQPPGMSDVKYLSLVDDVCRSKFTYVVASQVGIGEGLNGDARGRVGGLGGVQRQDGGWNGGSNMGIEKCVPAKTATSRTTNMYELPAPHLGTPQVYAANRYSSSPKGRWLARGVDILLHQYPSLRVAFIDTFHGQQGQQQYSVLIRGCVGTPAADADSTQETYRWALPECAKGAWLDWRGGVHR